MKYTIKQSRIAAVIYVSDENGWIWDCVFMSDGKPAEINRRGDSVNRPDDLPLSVRAAVNRQFSILFSLPYAARAATVENSQAFSVECAE